MEPRMLRRSSRRSTTAISAAASDVAPQPAETLECGHDAVHLKPDPNRDILCEECWKNREELVDRLLGPLMGIMGSPPPQAEKTDVLGALSGNEWSGETRVPEKTKEKKESQQQQKKQPGKVVMDIGETSEECKMLLPRGSPPSAEALAAAGVSKPSQSPTTVTSKPLASSSSPSPLSSSAVAAAAARARSSTPKRPLEEEDSTADVITPPPSRPRRGSRAQATSTSATGPARKLRRVSPAASSVHSDASPMAGSREPSVAPPSSPPPPQAPVSNKPAAPNVETGQKKQRRVSPHQRTIISFFKPLNSEKNSMPRAADAENPDPIIVLGQESTASQPLKRGRGRPKKKNTMVVEEKVETEETASEKKSRGRPRKSLAPTENMPARRNLRNGESSRVSYCEISSEEEYDEAW